MQSELEISLSIASTPALPCDDPNQFSHLKIASEFDFEGNWDNFLAFAEQACHWADRQHAPLFAAQTTYARHWLRVWQPDDYGWMPTHEGKYLPQTQRIVLENHNSRKVKIPDSSAYQADETGRHRLKIDASGTSSHSMSDGTEPYLNLTINIIAPAKPARLYHWAETSAMAAIQQHAGLFADEPYCQLGIFQPNLKLKGGWVQVHGGNLEPASGRSGLHEWHGMQPI